MLSTNPGRLPENGSMVPRLGVLPTYALVSDRRNNFMSTQIQRDTERHSYLDVVHDPRQVARERLNGAKLRCLTHVRSGQRQEEEGERDTQLQRDCQRHRGQLV